MLRFPAWETFIFQEASTLPTGPTYPAIRGAPTALHWGKTAGSLSRPHIYKVLRLIMSEATFSPAHTLHGVYKDNLNLTQYVRLQSGLVPMRMRSYHCCNYRALHNGYAILVTVAAQSHLLY